MRTALIATSRVTFHICSFGETSSFKILEIIIDLIVSTQNVVSFLCSPRTNHRLLLNDNSF
jgi:hypothetical protein